MVKHKQRKNETYRHKFSSSKCDYELNWELRSRASRRKNFLTKCYTEKKLQISSFFFFRFLSFFSHRYQSFYRCPRYWHMTGLYCTVLQDETVDFFLMNRQSLKLKLTGRSLNWWYLKTFLRLARFSKSDCCELNII
jgi:hypothetical protein